MAIFAQVSVEAQIFRWLRHDWRRYVQRGSELEKFYEEIERKYRPDQARVPAGNPDGGQWTDEGGGSSPQSSGGRTSGSPGEPAAGSGRSDPRVLSDATPDNYYELGTRLAQNEPRQRDLIRLEDEEARGGHTIEFHVNRSEEALKAQVLAIFDTNPNAKDSRSGSFPSLAAANKLVNSTLAQNQFTVDLVATGVLERKTIISEFGSVTGIEAVAANARSQPYIRETYNVGVVIVHDRYSSKGYQILTAFPTNRVQP